MMSVQIKDSDLFAVQGLLPKSRRLLVGAVDWILFLTAFEVPATVDEKVIKFTF